jgi:uncharacterized protein YycO
MQTLRQGDLLFQTSSGSDFGDAVENATRTDTLQSYAHVGIVALNDSGKFAVMEAMEQGVVLTSLNAFFSRNVQTHIFRLNAEYHHFIPQVLKYCIMQTGKHYDSAFLPDNDKFYCSELITEAFKFANNGNDFFQLQPMTFKSNGEFLPYWINLYKNLNMEIPEGVPGSNPTALSQDKRLERR